MIALFACMDCQRPFRPSRLAELVGNGGRAMHVCVDCTAGRPARRDAYAEPRGFRGIAPTTAS